MTKTGMQQIQATPTAQSVAEAATRAAGSGGLPPVHLWDPEFSGNLDMEIQRDGTWHYEGTPIGRPALVKLFSSILRKDGDNFYLVTPAEKVGIRVQDAPFVAVDANSAGEGDDQVIVFSTNVGDIVTAGPERPIRVARDPETGEPAPYVLVRVNLEALIDRKTFYRLVDLGVHRVHAGERWFGLWSGGAFFPMIRSSELE